MNYVPSSPVCIFVDSSGDLTMLMRTLFYHDLRSEFASLYIVDSSEDLTMLVRTLFYHDLRSEFASLYICRQLGRLDHAHENTILSTEKAQ